jgi:hypothetical protein
MPAGVNGIISLMGFVGYVCPRTNELNIKENIPPKIYLFKMRFNI